MMGNGTVDRDLRVSEEVKDGHTSIGIAGTPQALASIAGLITVFLQTDPPPMAGNTLLAANGSGTVTITIERI